MMILLILGIVLTIAGVMLLIGTRALCKASEFLNRKVFDDNTILAHRVLVALISLAVGVLMLWMYFGHHITVM